MCTLKTEKNAKILSHKKRQLKICYLFLIKAPRVLLSQQDFIFICLCIFLRLAHICGKISIRHITDVISENPFLFRNIVALKSHSFTYNIINVSYHPDIYIILTLVPTEVMDRHFNTFAGKIILLLNRRINWMSLKLNLKLQVFLFRYKCFYIHI